MSSETSNRSRDCQIILGHLAAVYQVNADAEVSGAELQHELGLTRATVEDCVRALAAEGLVEWDPLLSNLWLRLTDRGQAAAERLGRE